MKYIADLLTLARIVFSVAAMVAILFSNWVLAGVLLIVAGLTDAFDGAAAREWPYSLEDNQRLPWRINPHAWDNLADSILVNSVMLSLIIKIPIWRIIAPVVLIAGGIMLLGLNHFSKRNPRVAEIFDVMLGWTFVLEIFAMLITITIQSVDWWSWAIVVYAIAGIIILVIRWEKATSRPDAAYKKLSKADD
jgi:phosphatidylglycerophosphate synthase